jgi:serine O-acetyltransferase
MLATLRRDLRSARERDPAARSSFEIAICYSGVHAVWSHRVCHSLWHHDFKLLARCCSSLARLFTGVDIHPAAVLGQGVFIDHATGVVIGETAEVGDDVTIYQGGWHEPRPGEASPDRGEPGHDRCRGQGPRRDHHR